MSTDELSGGWMNRVVRIGDTVRRAPGETYGNGPFPTELLIHLGRVQWSGAPRFLGIDDEGRQKLTWIDGYVAWQVEQPPEISDDETLAAVARLIRGLHDLTAGTELAGDQEVVCHNDLMPGNTVYRDGGSGLRPVAFIDWDNAAPGARIMDVAHACWHFAGLGPQSWPAEAAHRMRVICDAYDLDGRSKLLGAVLWCQQRTWRWIRANTAVGDRSATEVDDGDSATTVRDAMRWVIRNRPLLEEALR